MGLRSCAVHGVGKRIERAQAHSTREVLDGQFWVAEIQSDPAAKNPHRRRVGIEHKSPVDEGGARVEFTNHIGQRETAKAESHLIVPTKLYCTPSEPCGFHNLLRGMSYPAICLTVDIANPCPAIGRCKIRIEFDSSIEKPQRLVVTLTGPRIKARYSTQI